MRGNAVVLDNPHFQILENIALDVPFYVDNDWRHIHVVNITCLRSQRLHWHCVSVVNDYADTKFSIFEFIETFIFQK